MGLRSLVSFGFVLIPIAVTISVLLGIQAYRESKGLPSNPFVDNSIKSSLYCQKAFGVTPYTNGQQYTFWAWLWAPWQGSAICRDFVRFSQPGYAFRPPTLIGQNDTGTNHCSSNVKSDVAILYRNPNQWALPDGYTGPGGLCMNVTTFDNGSYPTKTSAAEWSITWQFPRGPPTQPVHAFPNIKLDSTVFPIEISQVSAINFETEWYYGVGDDRPNVLNVADLTAAQLDANVAVDMFLDSDPKKATDTVQAKYEVMIWLGQFGASTQQIGLPQGAIATQVVNGTTFSLYSGVNGLGQSVLTWVASNAAGGVQTFNADIGPLLQGLTGLGGPTVNDYLGYIAFGSEALDSASNVTFYNKVLSMDVVS
ncbi:uncharacterized protein A1O5_04479 [Cladophialophora psammophila CBS 110553]|uniref:xyloglucan-specific endo-beta-1,4-glucanase n=1 Tax=Cladophialophora psammophila CBS 110553 TaxID=1182543 RepID=W9WUW1_9EURO|nr:uncharacterized protein A1O5_04479 [Cladophialophora psammophila CBS 110553]EXJ71977.1 hypothetical protein A1O5_04479 [Cladophialophora psammophila CBS 110553]